jgi:hypothetical protein
VGACACEGCEYAAVSPTQPEEDPTDRSPLGPLCIYQPSRARSGAKSRHRARPGDSAFLPMGKHRDKMPEITDAQYNEYRAYLPHGTPEAVAALAKKNGDLEGDNKKLRDQRADLNKKVPPEGAVVLQGDEAKRWEAFVALGKTPEELAAGAVLTADERKKWEAFAALDVKPEDIPNIVKERDELKAKDATRTRRDSIALLVKAEKLPDEAADTIADLGSLAGATFEVKQEKKKDDAGKDVTVEVGYVTLQGQQPVKFSEYREQNAVLKGIRTETATRQDEGGRSWVEQGISGTGGGYDPAKAGREMAEKQKAGTGAANLALT